MEKFRTHTSKAIPLPIENIDTDQIIPARFLKATNKAGFGENLFRDWRYNKDGSINSSFALTTPNTAGASSLQEIISAADRAVNMRRGHLQIMG